MVDALHFESIKMALKQDATGFVLTLRVHPDELPEELFRDFCGARYIVAMARISDDETPVSYKNRTKEAGILCKNKSFWEYLSSEIGEEVSSESSAVKVLYSICAISSRVQLNNSAKAKKAFDNMMENYNEWSKEKFGV
tara:strand:- start:1034 stop:1450 length:417 start_codon:yes stop_codon:yes gene_type:complete